MRRFLACIALVLAVVLASCNDPDESLGCRAVIMSGAQSGTLFNVTGQFHLAQPIMTLDQPGAGHYVISASDVSSSQASFDISGVTPGVYNATWFYSCLDETGNGSISTSITRITVQ